MTDHVLSIDRVIDAPIEAVWRAMTEHLPLWWAPKPWTTEVTAFDLASGGRFELTMRGTDGEGGPVNGMVLEVTPERRLVFTNAIDGDANPQTPQPVSIVGVLEITSGGAGKTLYRASARHWTAEAMEQHRTMGFDEGWGMCADQLKALAEGLDA